MMLRERGIEKAMVLYCAKNANEDVRLYSSRQKMRESRVEVATDKSIVPPTCIEGEHAKVSQAGVYTQ